MAKTSSINRNEKRRKMAKLADARRKKLKALIMKKDTPMEERFAAVLKLAEDAAQLGEEPHPQPLRAYWPSARLLSQDEAVAHRTA